MLHNRFHTSIIQNMCFSHVGCCSYAEQLLCAKMFKCGLKLIPRDTCLKILKLDKFENVTFILSSPIAPSPPLPSPPEGEDFSNELPSSSSSLSLPSTPSLSSSSPSSPDLPHSPVVPHPESPLSPVTHGNLRLEVAAPHYHEDQLQVKVYWKMSHHGELF